MKYLGALRRFSKSSFLECDHGNPPRGPILVRKGNENAMSFEMLRALVQQRIAAGASTETIRGELAAMGVGASDCDVLLREAKKPVDALPGREPLSMWDFLPLIPMWLGPLVILIMAAVLDGPKLAIGILITGMIVHMIGKVCMVILAFSEGIGWGIAWFFLQCFVEIMLLMVQPRKFWKVVLCEIFGVAMMMAAFAVDQKAVAAFLEIKLPPQ